MTKYVYTKLIIKQTAVYLYTLLMATDQKQQNHKKAVLTTITLTFRRCYCG